MTEQMIDALVVMVVGFAFTFAMNWQNRSAGGRFLRRISYYGIYCGLAIAVYGVYLVIAEVTK